jgi:hypothetical protein
LLSDTVWISHTSLLAEENAIRDMAIAIRKVCENIREI